MNRHCSMISTPNSSPSFVKNHCNRTTKLLSLVLFPAISGSPSSVPLTLAFWSIGVSLKWSLTCVFSQQKSSGVGQIARFCLIWFFKFNFHAKVIGTIRTYYTVSIHTTSFDMTRIIFVMLYPRFTLWALLHDVVLRSTNRCHMSVGLRYVLHNSMHLLGIRHVQANHCFHFMTSFIPLWRHSMSWWSSLKATFNYTKGLSDCSIICFWLNQSNMANTVLVNGTVNGK